MAEAQDQKSEQDLTEESSGSDPDPGIDAVTDSLGIDAVTDSLGIYAVTDSFRDDLKIAEPKTKASSKKSRSKADDESEKQDGPKKIKGFTKEIATEIIMSIKNDASPYNTHLSCYTEVTKQYECYKNEDRKLHAEEIMLAAKEESALPNQIWVSRSPCDTESHQCAQSLFKRYKDSEYKPTIYFAKFYIGKSQEHPYLPYQIDTSPHIKEMMKLTGKGFKLEVWDCIEEFKDFGEINPKDNPKKETHEEIIKNAKEKQTKDKETLERLIMEFKKLDHKEELGEKTHSRKIKE